MIAGRRATANRTADQRQSADPKAGADAGAGRPGRGSGGAERRLLQGVIAGLGLVPVGAGAAGVLLGPGFLDLDRPWPVDLDSHFRYLSGLFLAAGLAFWSCVPAVERRGARFRLLGALVVAGGLARLLSLLSAGSPSAGHLAGLLLELAVVPLLLVWQRRIERQAGRGRA